MAHILMDPKTVVQVLKADHDSSINPSILDIRALGSLFRKHIRLPIQDASNIIIVDIGWKSASVILFRN